jgi:FtsP/CotA-like multicopper oxidase with cupredoxin domain
MDGTYGITQCAIQPNSSFTYNFTLQQGGSYWWHAHYSTTYQDGLFGPLIIHGRDEPDYNINGDIVLMVDDWYHNFSMDLLPAFFAPGNEGVEPVPDNGLINGYLPIRVWLTKSKCVRLRSSARISM